MATRCVGFVVVGETVTVVDVEVPDESSDPIKVISDDTWKLQNGERPPAYAVLHQRCGDHIRENKIDVAVVKASALPSGAAKLGLLTSAEVRGVVLAAAASACSVRSLSKAAISRTYGERKVDDYLADDEFWADKTTGGKLRKSSREAAMLIIAARK